VKAIATILSQPPEAQIESAVLPRSTLTISAKISRSIAVAALPQGFAAMTLAGVHDNKSKAAAVLNDSWVDLRSTKHEGA
jgi:hypothetical protein